MRAHRASTAQPTFSLDQMVQLTYRLLHAFIARRFCIPDCQKETNTKILPLLIREQNASFVYKVKKNSVFLKHSYRERPGYNYLLSVLETSKMNVSLFFLYYILTPSSICISSKHECTFPDQRNSVCLPITETVKRTCCPAVKGGTVTQLPRRINTNRLLQKFLEVIEKEAIALDDV